MNKKLLSAAVFAGLLPTASYAGVDKVYSPYVELGEIEFEMRGIHQLESDAEHKVKVGLGYGLSQRMFIEGYLVIEKEADGNTEIEEAEIEAKFQLSEQGEYWADFGLLVELEKELEHDKWELKAGPVIQKQFGKWVTTANVLLEKQFGSDKSEDEVEVLGSFQVKYRYDKNFEPAIEYYVDEHTQALGPVLTGADKWNNNKLKWELGVLFGLNDETSDSTLRWQLELEF